MTLCVAAALAWVGGGCLPTDPAPTGPETASLLYVLTAWQGGLVPTDQEGTYTLTLRDPASSLTWFTDRPDRQAGHEDLDTFISHTWPAQFSETPPQASIELTDDDGRRQTLAVEMSDPVYDPNAETLVCTARILEGEAVGTLHDVSVFVDGVVWPVVEGHVIKPGARLDGADLTDVDLTGVHLSEATFGGTAAAFSDIRIARRA